MSPASQGALQVERYIGPCLISRPGTPGVPGTVGTPATTPPASPRHANGYRYPPGAWAGVPLIAVVQHPRRNRNNTSTTSTKPPPEGRSPLSRLAIHTQGAPLILAGRYPNGNRKQQQQQQLQQAPQQQQPQRPPAKQPPQVQQVSPASDSLSVASDESSGHSENSLPRIIKPRKRRKKDRKPPALAQPAPEDAVTPHPVPTVSLKTIAKEPSHEPPDEPKLHHEFDEVKEHLDAGVVTVCQCRYCDPAGLIWDVDQNCYSPFLTPPGPPGPLGPPPLQPLLQRSSLFPDLVLRRSWSEPSPSRKDSESSTSSASSTDSEGGAGLARRVAWTASSPHGAPSRQALEVSSEIVTSHNGHRDIEIKFFSAPPLDPEE